jgi:hypothetical protein
VPVGISSGTAKPSRSSPFRVGGLTLSLDDAVERGLDPTAGRLAAARAALLRGEDATAGILLSEMSGIFGALGCLLLGDHEGARRRCRPVDPLCEEARTGLEKPRPRRVSHTSNRNIQEHVAVALQAFQEAQVQTNADLRHQRLEDAAFRFSVASQIQAPGREVALYDEGVTRLEMGQYAEAEALAEGRGYDALVFMDAYVNRYPKFIPARLLRSRIRSRLGDSATARPTP